MLIIKPFEFLKFLLLVCYSDDSSVFTYMLNKGRGGRWRGGCRCRCRGGVPCPHSRRSSQGMVHRALQSYHLTLSLAVDVVAAYLSAGGLGGFALEVLGLVEE